jgi:hypothetical protein
LKLLDLARAFFERMKLMKKTTLILIVACLFLTACGIGSGTARKATKPPPPIKAETDFAREAIVLLTKGDPAVEDMIDWETFKVFDTDVGSKYWYMPGESAKASFRKSFIESFASSFRNSGQSMEVLRNWRVESTQGATTTVNADHPNGKTFVFTVLLKDGWQKLSGLSGK